MQFTLAAITTLIAAVSAQTFEGIPECAVPCILNAAAVTDCGSTDYKCMCDNRDAIQAEDTPCVISACGLTVVTNEVLPAVEAVCDSL